MGSRAMLHSTSLGSTVASSSSKTVRSCSYLSLPVRKNVNIAKLSTTPGLQRVVRLVCEAKKIESSSNVECIVRAIREVELPSPARPALVAAVANLLMATPAHAGNIFDFGLTMPIIMAQFLLLMVILEKTMFTPVGNALEERAKYIRDSLLGAKEASEKLAAAQAKVMEDMEMSRETARKEAAELEKKLTSENAAALAAVEADLGAKLQINLDAIEADRQQGLKDMEAQVEILSETIYPKVMQKSMPGWVKDRLKANTKQAVTSV